MRRVRVTSDNRPTAAALSNQIPVLRSYIDVLVDVSVINQTVLKFELCHETMLSPAGVAEREPTDLLNKRKCLEYLAALRHAKWFQVNSSLKYFFFFPTTAVLCGKLRPCVFLLNRSNSNSNRLF